MALSLTSEVWPGAAKFEKLSDNVDYQHSHCGRFGLLARALISLSSLSDDINTMLY